MQGHGPDRLHPGPCVPGGRGFSLIEMLVVMAVLGLLLAVAAPGFVALGPSRKAGIHELAGFLENARSRAVAGRCEMVVAFADERFRVPDQAMRAYALFTRDPGEDEGTLRQITPWRSLPAGLIFASREHFEIADDVDFRTLLDLPGPRRFPVPDEGGIRSGSLTVALPAVVFGPDGGVREPDFSQADALHVGVIEGYFDIDSRQPVVTAKKDELGRPVAECLAIGFYTGRTRVLTD